MRRFIYLVVGILVISGAYLISSNKPIDIKNTDTIAIAKPVSTSKSGITGSLSGTQCENGGYRPWAVMMPSDPEARPLSGIGQADMVFEMPVTENGITRMMAVFQCTHPKEIGSIRSARIDFIPYVRGLNAIYIHWGGEHDALAILNSHITDNIDCLKLDGSTCIRKKNAPMPHNGFTTSSLILAKIKAFGYKMMDSSVSYPHTEGLSIGKISPPALYQDDNQVNWSYDSQANLYARSRGGKSEIDRTTGKQIKTSNVVVLHTTSEYVSILYNRVKTVGSGTLTAYQNGTSIRGTWKKSSDQSKLMFLDSNNKEINFVPGSTWIQVVTQ